MASMPHPSPDGQPDQDPEQIILGVDTHQEVHVAALITTGIVDEVGGEDRVCLVAQECGPGLVVALGCGFDAGGLEDFPDRRRGDCDAEDGQFAVESSVAPTGILLWPGTGRGPECCGRSAAGPAVSAETVWRGDARAGRGASAGRCRGRRSGATDAASALVALVALETPTASIEVTRPQGEGGEERPVGRGEELLLQRHQPGDRQQLPARRGANTVSW
jgi:hypothetical protein